MSFKATNERIASLRVKVTGGVLNVFAVYAPHDGRDFDSLHTFFSNLSENMKSRSSHEEIIALGDFNAQLGYVGAGEEEMVGEYVIQKVLRDRPTLTNRELFMEYCSVHHLRVANTFFNYPNDCLVSF